MRPTLHSTSHLCVHDLAQAVAGLRLAASLQAHPVLLSPPDAAQYAGSPWWRALIAQASAATGIACEDWLDCGSLPGPALAALRDGCPRIIAWSASPRLCAMAAACGVRLLTSRPASLDLGVASAATLLPAWLIGSTGLSPSAVVTTRVAPGKDGTHADHAPRPPDPQPVRKR